MLCLSVPFGNVCVTHISEQRCDITTFTTSTATTSRMSSSVQRTVCAQSNVSLANAANENNVFGIPKDEFDAIVKRLNNVGTVIELETSPPRNEIVDLTSSGDDIDRLLNEHVPDEVVYDAFELDDQELFFANLNKTNTLDVPTTKSS